MKCCQSDIASAIGWFHDGGLTRICHQKAHLELDIHTCEMRPQDNEWGLVLDDEGILRGTLTLSGVAQISENGVLLSGMWPDRDDGEILTFEIKGNLLKLGINWWDYPEDVETQLHSSMLITADQILWHDPLNDVELDLTGINTTKGLGE